MTLVGAAPDTRGSEGELVAALIATDSLQAATRVRPGVADGGGAATSTRAPSARPAAAGMMERASGVMSCLEGARVRGGRTATASWTARAGRR